jgi:hypothetical protein
VTAVAKTCCVETASDAVAVSEVVEVGAWAAETVSDALAVSETADVNA